MQRYRMPMLGRPRFLIPCGDGDIVTYADAEQLERVADEIHKLLLESQTSIGGDWRTRRDAALASYAAWKEK